MLRGRPLRIHENYAGLAFPSFIRGAAGLASKAVRLLFNTMVPKEYQRYLDVFLTLPKESKMHVSAPTFATLLVLSINTFTERHSDITDEDFGFAGLVALGEYAGKHARPH